MDAQVEIVNVDVPDDGRFILGYRVTDNGDGTWHYEYAMHYLCADRSARTFSVPLPSGVAVTNVGFRDVDYHSGEVYALTDWIDAQAGGAITWSTETEAQNANANALRWGTMYDFRFDADTPPEPASVTIDLFKAGIPASVSATSVGPLATGIPAAADWGMFVIALLLGVAGTVVFARRGRVEHTGQ